MYKNKLTPEEALSAIILRMKYDSKKTLNENLEIAEVSLPRTDPDYKIAQEIWFGVGGPGTNTDKFLSGLKKIKTPQQFNRVNSQVAYFTHNLTIDAWVNDDFGSDDGNAVNEIINHLKSIGIDATADFDTAGNFRENTFKIKNIPSTPTTTGDNSAAAQVTKGITAGPENTKKAIEAGVKNKTVTNPTAPADLDVKKFQDWLDNNKGEWAWSPKQQRNYKVEQNPNRGYGRFGPSTQRMWNDPKVKEEYLKSLQGTDKSEVSSFEQGEEVFGSTYDDLINDK